MTCISYSALHKITIFNTLVSTNKSAKHDLQVVPKNYSADHLTQQDLPDPILKYHFG